VLRDAILIVVLFAIAAALLVGNLPGTIALVVLAIILCFL
jgi:hypothetical protein